MFEQLEVKFGFISDTGLRKNNEDYLGAYLGEASQRSSKGIVTAIADGIGGESGGRQAAETTVRGFVDGYYGMPDTLGVDRSASQALMAMNRWVYSQRKTDSTLKNMGTTFSGLILRGRHAHIIHIGDTRIYRLREHQLERLTKDHVHQHPDMQHVLFRAIGLEDSAHIDYATYNLKPHDRFLLCSDGIHGVLSDKNIHSLLEDPCSPEESAKRLVDAALKAGSHDNASAAIVEVIGLPPPDQTDLIKALKHLPVLPLPDPGQVIDNFTLKEVICDGRYSRLYVAIDNITGQEHALKFPHPRICDEAAHHRAFAIEAWVTARIHSPWIVEMDEHSSDKQSRLYSVMPRYIGQTLEQRLLHKPEISVDEGAPIGIKLGKAIYSLNRRRIYHRDIKPENVMLLNDNGLKLLDLGIARLPGIEDDETLSAPGTPSYMAPELFHGEHGDEKSEVFALGTTLYRMFSGGHYPYGEVEAFSTPRFNKFTSLSQHRPDLPLWLCLIIEKATQVDPTQRFGDVMEMAFELENGFRRGMKSMQQKKPLLERNPILFWRSLSIILMILLLISLMIGR